MTAAIPAEDKGRKRRGRTLENFYGEQWVFIGNRATGKVTIRGGDLGWEHVLEVSAEKPCPDVILNASERMWVITCFMALTGLSFDEVTKRYNATARQIVAAARQKFQHNQDE